MQLFVFYLSLGLVQIGEILGKNSGNPDLVSEKRCCLKFKMATMEMGIEHLSNSEFSFCLDVSLVHQVFVNSDPHYRKSLRTTYD